MTPLLSICIPTFDRAELLDLCLTRVQALHRFGRPLEVVVSDNKPTEPTAAVIDKFRPLIPNLVYCKHYKRVEPYEGLVNAIRNASGKYVVLLADDDSLIPEPLLAYLDRLEQDPQLMAIFADWFCHDDEQEKDLHTYHKISPVRFGPQQPLELINFVFNHIFYAEMGIYRRSALLRCDCLVRHSIYPFHLWMYLLSRAGFVACEPVPYYREHWKLKKRFQRAVWSNMSNRYKYIGDELRLELETFLLWALQDAGMTHVAEHQRLQARQMIENFLHTRTMLEVQRACHEKNWIRAAELRRRMVLWYGPGSPADQQRDLQEIAMPAALQAAHELCCGMSDVAGLLLSGFQTPLVRDFYRQQFPELRLLEPADLAAAGTARPVVLYRNDPGPQATVDSPAPEGYRLYLDRLLENYRINQLRLTVDNL